MNINKDSATRLGRSMKKAGAIQPGGTCGDLNDMGTENDSSEFTDGDVSKGN